MRTVLLEVVLARGNELQGDELEAAMRGVVVSVGARGALGERGGIALVPNPGQGRLPAGLEAGNDVADESTLYRAVSMWSFSGGRELGNTHLDTIGLDGNEAVSTSVQG